VSLFDVNSQNAYTAAHMPDRIKDKVIVVTGAAQGIGYGIAELLASEGARVVIGDVQREKGEAAAAKICAQGGEALFQHTDILKEDDCANLLNTATQHYGKLDGLVNNVGWPARATIEETTAELWDTYMNLNLRGAFFCCKHALPLMKARGDHSGGSIVNIGTIHGLQAQPNLLAYGVAKGGLLTLTRTLAGAYRSDHIRVNYVIPGWVVSEGEIAIHEKLGMSEDELRARGAKQPMGRHQTPQDAAQTALFLLSDESSQITGQIMHVDGGMSSLVFR
jgi:NAD(P)-dependent dehydrogenase (short-subunit alcohol dehydrogenase family)